MSQAIFDTINPAITSGNQLAQILNDFKEAYVSGNSGIARPSQLEAGGMWVDMANDAQNSWDLKIYDGTNDVTVFTINTETMTASIASADTSFDVTKVSGDAVGPILNLIKKRIVGAGQVLEGDTLGEIDFQGTTNTGLVSTQARIRAVAMQDFTTSAKGTYLAFEATGPNSTTVQEVLRIFWGRVGIGTTEPVDTFHVDGSGIRSAFTNPSAQPANITLEKDRVVNNGQALAADEIGHITVLAKTPTGDEAKLFRLEVSAQEDITATAQGSKVSFKAKNTGSNVFVEKMVFDNSGVKIDNLVVQNLTATNTTMGTIVETGDASILINKEGTQAMADAVNSGIEVEMTDAPHFKIGYDSSKASKVVAGNVGALKELVNVDSTQTLTNKTITGASILGATGITRADVGLSNVDNTSDATKNAAAATLTNKTIVSPNITTPSGLVKSDVGLGNVDNTSDATKNSATATLTNKTLTAPVINNAVMTSPTGIVKADVGLGNVDNTSDATKNSATATLTNKTINNSKIDLGVASINNYFKPSKDLKATLLALPRNEATLYYATDKKRYFYDNGSTLKEIGSGTGSNLDTILQITGDEEVTDWIKGNGGAFLTTTGTFGGTLVKDEVTPINGDASWVYTQTAASLGDHFGSLEYPVLPKFRGKQTTLTFAYDYNGNSNDISIEVFDVTNGAVIPNSAYVTTSNGIQTLQTNVSLAANTAAVRIGFRVVALNSGKIFKFDDVVLSGDITRYTNLSAGTVGEVISYPSLITPAGFLLCNGIAVSRSQYADLFAVLGTTHGAGNGSTTFNLPDYRGVVLRGKDYGRLVNADGDLAIGTYQGDMYASHSHPMSHANGTAGADAGKYGQTGIASSTGFRWSLGNTAVNSLPWSGPQGGNETRMRNVTTNFFIRYAKTSVDGIVVQNETFSTDNAALKYASSTEYTLANLAEAPVGTFITFTIAAGSNTRTQTTVAPTQSISSMNANGIQVSTRALNANSTAGLPSDLAIQIGKGLKGTSLKIFRDLGKNVSGSLDFFYEIGGGSSYGALYKEYDPTTGILIFDAGITNANAASFLYGTPGAGGVAASSGYLTINASKNPAMSGLNIDRQVSIMCQTNTAAQSLPHSAATNVLFQTTLEDSHNAVTFTGSDWYVTIPEDGLYLLAGLLSPSVVGGSTYHFQNYITNSTTGELIFLENKTVTPPYSGEYTMGGSAVKRLLKGQILRNTVYNFNNAALARNLSATGANNRISITKLGK